MRSALRRVAERYEDWMGRGGHDVGRRHDIWHCMAFWDMVDGSRCIISVHIPHRRKQWLSRIFTLYCTSSIGYHIALISYASLLTPKK